MGKIIEYALISVDGAHSDPAGLGFMRYRDDAYLRDGLGVLCACEAMIMGRGVYEGMAKMWPSRSDHPWAHRLNTMPKYVFTSTLTTTEWDNCTIVGGWLGMSAETLLAPHQRPPALAQAARGARGFLSSPNLYQIGHSEHVAGVQVSLGAGGRFWPV